MILNLRSVSTLCLFLSLVGLTGCQRSSGQMIEDAKTATHYSGKALKSLGGKHGESRQVNSDEDFGWAFGSNEDVKLFESHFTANNSSSSSAMQSSSNASYDSFYAPSGETSSVFKKIFFDTNDDVVRGKDNHSKVYAIASYLKDNPSTLVYVEGHCDERGEAGYNYSLGSRRASSVRNMLIEQGASPSQVFTISFGKEKPEVQGHNEEAWHHNRRSQFKLYAK